MEEVMVFLGKNSKLALAALAVVLFFIFSSEKITEKDFVGKWRSSKLVTPIYLYANSEWEIKKDDGAILQYGIWQYQDKKLTWSYKMDSSVGHDVNAVVSANSTEFKLLENDGTTTTFTRLE
jgi:hypothetical protein